MNVAENVDALIVNLNEQLRNGGIPLSDAMWETALACIGWPYVYSAWGALCTPAERRKRFKLKPDKTTIKSKCKGFDNGICSGCQWFPDGKRTRCYDCRGFCNWVMKQFGFELEGDTVASQWNSKKNWCAKGKVSDGIPDNVLVNLFIYNGSKWTHTGFYYRGSTIECSVNVQYHEKMVNNRWTHWAVAKCFENGWKAPEKAPETAKPEEPKKEQTKVNKTIKKGNYGTLVRACQTMLSKLGYDLGCCGIDGDFGQATEKAVKAFQKDNGLKQDGIVGEKTWGALYEKSEALAEKPPVQYYTVIVPHQTAEQADKILEQYPGSKKEIERG